MRVCVCGRGSAVDLEAVQEQAWESREFQFRVDFLKI